MMAATAARASSRHIEGGGDLANGVVPTSLGLQALDEP
jgi:hypothetical protein